MNFLYIHNKRKKKENREIWNKPSRKMSGWQPYPKVFDEQETKHKMTKIDHQKSSTS